MRKQTGFLVSHPTGNTFVRALLEKLEEKNLLVNFHTTIGFGHGCSTLFSMIKKHRKYAIPDSKINRQWTVEIMRLLHKGKQHKKRRFTDFSYQKLDLQMSRNLSSSAAKVIHAYEDGALSSFQLAKERGIQCSYELPIAHWATSRRLLTEEAERHPAWEPTLESTRETEEKLLRKEEELRLADRITCPSKFVLDSIPLEIKRHIPCQISPFGSPFITRDLTPKKSTPKDTFKVLFVGSMSQRKGLADLFEAMRFLKNDSVELSVLGQPSMPMEFYRKQFPNFKYFHSCSNHKVQHVMKEHDVLVLPSIIEGRALVQQEALACGTPLIVTPNAGGDDLIEEGLTGHLVPIRSPEKIAEKIVLLRESKILDADRKIICQEKANDFSWHSYAQKIITFNLSSTN